MLPNLFSMISQIYPIEIDVKKYHYCPFFPVEKYMICVLYLIAFMEKLIVTFRILIIKGILLKIPRVKTTIFYNSYFNRIIKTWNILPDSIRASSNINFFKRRIKEFYLNKPNTYDVNNQCSWSAACGCSKHY